MRKFVLEYYAKLIKANKKQLYRKESIVNGLK